MGPCIRDSVHGGFGSAVDTAAGRAQGTALRAYIHNRPRPALPEVQQKRVYRLDEPEEIGIELPQGCRRGDLFDCAGLKISNVIYKVVDLAAGTVR
jgi:hypothetical protein